MFRRKPTRNTKSAISRSARKRISDGLLSAGIGAAVAIVLSPISLVLSFHLTNYLSRPVLSLEYAEMFERAGSVKVPVALISRFVQSPGFQTNAMHSMQLGSLLSYYMARTEMAAEERPKLVSIVAEYKGILEGRRAALSELEKELEQANGSEDFEVVQQKYGAMLGALASFSNVETLDKPKLKAKLSIDLSAIQQAEQIREALNEAIQALEPQVSSIRVKVSILNRGNTDGLVFQTGKMRFANGPEFSIVRTNAPRAQPSTQTPAVQVVVTNPPSEPVSQGAVGKVEKNSMAEFWFSLERNGLPDELAGELDKVLKAKPRAGIALKLFDHERRPLEFIDRKTPAI
jgi:hypothetical protein